MVAVRPVWKINLRSGKGRVIFGGERRDEIDSMVSLREAPESMKNTMLSLGKRRERYDCMVDQNHLVLLAPE